MKNTKTSVIIAVRDTDLRLSLDLLLREDPCLNVVGTVTTAESALVMTKAENPELVLLECRLSKRASGDVLKEIKANTPSPQVILLGNRADQKQSVDNLEVDAYLLIGGTPEKLISTIGELISKE